MVVIRFYSQTDAESGRVLKSALKLCDLQMETVADLKAEAVKQLDQKDLNDFTMIHCGKPLEEDAKIADIPSLTLPNAAIFVFFKRKVEPISEVSTADIESLLTSVQVALQDRNARAQLFKIAGDVEVLQNLIATVPGLKDDLEAQAVVKDPFLLIHWLAPPNIRKTLAKHPALYEAAQQLLAIMHTEASKPPANPLLFAPEAEEDESDGDNDNPQPRRMARPAGLRPITADQLAMALAAASPSGSNATQPSTSRLATPARSAINADFLQQAIAAAASPSAPPPITESQLAQLRDMGFNDDVENRKALTATKGNVEAALEWIINEREQNEMD